MHIQNRYSEKYLYLYLKLSSCLQGLALSPKASEYSWPVPSVTLIYSHMDATATTPLCPTRISSTLFTVHSTTRNLHCTLHTVYDMFLYWGLWRNRNYNLVRLSNKGVQLQRSLRNMILWTQKSIIKSIIHKPQDHNHKSCPSSVLGSPIQY